MARWPPVRQRGIMGQPRDQQLARQEIDSVSESKPWSRWALGARMSLSVFTG